MILPLKLSILQLSEILMYEFWYDYVKPKHDGKQNSVIGCTKTDDIYKDIAEDAETIFDTSNFELDGPLPEGKKKQKVIGLIKYELGGKMMIKLIELGEKTYSYLIDNN